MVRNFGTVTVLRGNKKELDMAYCWLMAVYRIVLGHEKGTEEFKKVPVTYGVMAYQLAMDSTNGGGYN